MARTLRDGDMPAAGNLTAAVMVDLPVGVGPVAGRLAEIARRSRRLHTGTRAAASRFVMGTVGQLLPVPAHAWFARAVYGRRFFHGIVSNMPGPRAQLFLAGQPLAGGYPILPLAPGAPLAVGALGWGDRLCLGIAAQPWLLPDPEVFVDALLEAFGELAGGSVGVSVPGGQVGSVAVG